MQHSFWATHFCFIASEEAQFDGALLDPLPVILCSSLYHPNVNIGEAATKLTTCTKIKQRNLKVERMKENE